MYRSCSLFVFLRGTQLLEKVWDYCNMIRIYTKPKGQIPDYNEPVILHDTNPSLEQFCNRIHKVSLVSSPCTAVVSNGWAAG